MTFTSGLATGKTVTTSPSATLSAIPSVIPLAIHLAKPSSLQTIDVAISINGNEQVALRSVNSDGALVFELSEDKTMLCLLYKGIR